MSEAKPTALPEVVRQRIVALAANALPALATDEIPVGLRRFARFTPSRRAKLAARPLAAALATDDDFRSKVGAKVIEAAGEIGAAVASGTPAAAADPVDNAALAYLAQSPGWEQLIETVTEPRDTTPRRTAEVDKLTEQLERVRANAKLETDRLRKELAAAKDESAKLTTQLREANTALRASERKLAKALGDLAAEKGRASGIAAEHSAALRRMKTQLDRALAVAESARTAQRSDRHADSARLNVLLSTITAATSGLRTALDLEAEDKSPADVVAATVATTNDGRTRLAATDEVSRLNQLLAIPRMHLIVDGYNVTKTGFGEISLERQRTRLIRSLAALAAQTGAEITAVFDGTERLTGLVTAPRGVRVLFSQGDQIADELIEALVLAEPAGRPLTVVTSDKEVIRAALRAGRHTVPARALVDRLSRG